jgi:hypothetical protein
MKQHITSIDDLKPQEKVILLTHRLGLRHYSGAGYDQLEAAIDEMDVTVAEYEEMIVEARRFLGYE